MGTSQALGTSSGSLSLGITWPVSGAVWVYLFFFVFVFVFFFGEFTFIE